MQKTINTGGIGCIIKGVLSALIVTLIGIFIFAFIAKVACLSQNVIKSVNQFIKILSIFLGCNFSVKEKGGLLKGLLIGLIYMTLSYLLFALFGAEIDFGLKLIIDLIFGIIVGGISGVITVNVKK